MFLASVAILIIVQISANYNFIFPTSNTTNMLAYSAGGIYKKDMVRKNNLILSDVVINIDITTSPCPYLDFISYVACSCCYFYLY